MRSRAVLAFSLVCIAALPAVGWADGLPPHSNDYAEHAHWNGKGTNVEVLVHRVSHRADLFVTDPCLGKQSGYSLEAIARGVKFHGDLISWRGSATVYTQTGAKTPTLDIRATVSSKEVKGSYGFPFVAGCSNREFTAKLTSSSK